MLQIDPDNSFHCCKSHSFFLTRSCFLFIYFSVTLISSHSAKLSMRFIKKMFFHLLSPRELTHSDTQYWYIYKNEHSYLYAQCRICDCNFVFLMNIISMDMTCSLTVLCSKYSFSSFYDHSPHFLFIYFFSYFLLGMHDSQLLQINKIKSFLLYGHCYSVF